jgi:hypothetical protein
MPNSFVSATNEHKGQWGIEKRNRVYECPLFNSDSTTVGMCQQAF